jgi:putative transposase
VSDTVAKSRTFRDGSRSTVVSVGRELRILDPDGIYHVVSRGNNRGPITFDATDRAGLREELGAAATRYRWEVFAWCHMTTHAHIVLRAPEGGISRGLQEINGNHARRTNYRHGRVGHLFHNRFRCGSVDSDAHLINAIAYVLRNPVAAGLCEHPGQWRESSYRATVGRERAPWWLVTDQVLSLFGSSPESGRAAFAQLVGSGHLPVSDTDGWEPPVFAEPLTADGGAA